MSDPSRRPEFERNAALDAVLEQLNDRLAGVDDPTDAENRMPRWPVVLVVGPPRSGTTLMTQWLARSGVFGYPTNLIARFHRAPEIGALVQRILTDPALQFRDEFSDIGDDFAETPFRSSIGKTRGLLAPNVFWHFWRRFFPEGETHALDDEALARVDGKGFAASLAALEAALEKPLALKAMWIDWNIPFVSSLLERCVFLYMDRHPFYTVQSILQARERHSGDRRRWWSFRPPDYHTLRRLDPIGQVVGQVDSMKRAVEAGLAALPRQRSLHVGYEAFCRDPATTWAELGVRLSAQGLHLPRYAGPVRFDHRDAVRVPTADREAISSAWLERTGRETRP